VSRRLLGGALVAIICAFVSAPHNHSIAELNVGSSAAGGERAVTAHDPNSRTSHWHAVVRLIKEDPCLACQWHRLPGACPPAQAALHVLSVALANGAPLVTARSASLNGPSSRAPPVLF
jgi:hypothetical protein